MNISIHPRMDGTIDVIDGNGNKLTFSLDDLQAVHTATHPVIKDGYPRLEGGDRHHFLSEGRKMALEYAIAKELIPPFANI